MKFAIIDIESSGGNPKRDRIIDIAVYLHDGQKIINSFTSLVNPETSISPFITKLTGISNDMVADAPRFYEIARQIVDITNDAIFVAHNVDFDYAYLRNEFKRLGFNYTRPKLCTINLSRRILPGHTSYGLDTLCRELSIPVSDRHRADGDARATTLLFEVLLECDQGHQLQHELEAANRIPTLPANLSVESVTAIPEETGVYYFHDETGRIIYVGKSIDLRKRVLQHFQTGSSTSADKSHRMLRKIYDVSYEITGSELVALLLESSEIKNHRPTYNKAQRSRIYQWGLFSNTNKSGYSELWVRRRNKADKLHPIALFEKESYARNILAAKAAQQKLCPCLCGEPALKSGETCLRQQSEQCLGAGVGQEKPSAYNKRVEKALLDLQYPYPNFLIVGEGRQLGEFSVVGVQNGEYIGYGFFEAALIDNAAEIIDGLRKMPFNPEAPKIICNYIKKNKSDKIIRF